MAKYNLVPRNEMQVREWFAVHLDEFEWDIAESVSGYPDYILADKSGKKYRVEAEYESGNFISHQHDPEGCDFIICWFHNIQLPVPVYELQSKTMWNAGACGYVKPSPSELQMKIRAKKAAKSTSKNQIAFNTCRSEYRDFVLAVGQDAIAHNEFMKQRQPSRLRLLLISRHLENNLRRAGMDFESMHPYDLMRFLEQFNE